jgi:hypothetical protein
MILSAANTALEKTQPQLLLTVKNGTITQKSEKIPLWCGATINNIERIVGSKGFTRGRNRD